MSLCTTFCDLSLSTWSRLGEARSVDFQIGEETITDLILLQLKSHHATEVITQEFDKHEERNTGADWEMWFVGKSEFSIGFRIQAKIIHFASNTFRHLHYGRKNTRFIQCNKLILDALEGDHPTIPLFCLYTHWNTPSEQYLTKWMPEASHGCSLLSPFKVRGLRDKHTCDLASLLPMLFPWQTLICGNLAADLAFRV